MRLLSKYLTKEFYKLLTLCQIIFLFIYLIIDFLGKIDNFIDANVSKGLIFQYFLFKTPFVMVQMLPPATLISIIIMFSIMKKTNEIVAIKACGLNLFKVAQPVIVAAVIIGIGSFFWAELIVPYTSSRSNEIWNIDVEKRDPGLYYGSNQIWYRGPDSIYWIRHYDNKKNIMEQPTFYFFDKSFNLVKKIDGRRGYWEEGRWRIEQGIVQQAIGNGEYVLKRFDNLYLDLPETPETFIETKREPEEMSYWQLQRYAERVHAEGYDNTQYLVDMNIKAAFPVIILIMVLIGIAISLLNKDDKIPVVVSIGIGICFLFMIAFGFSRSLGLAGVLPPVIAAWITNLIFFFIGIYLMLHVER